MPEGPNEYPKSEIPRVFREDKKPDESDVQKDVIRQITNARSRTLDYDDDPEAIGQDWPALKGHEAKFLEFANNVATRQVSEVAEISSPPKASSELQRPASIHPEEEEREPSEAARKFDELGEKSRSTIETRASQDHQQRLEQERILERKRRSSLDSVQPSAQSLQQQASERTSRRDLLRGKQLKPVVRQKP